MNISSKSYSVCTFYICTLHVKLHYRKYNRFTAISKFAGITGIHAADANAANKQDTSSVETQDSLELLRDKRRLL